MVFKIIITKGKVSFLSPKNFRTKISAKKGIKNFKGSTLFKRGFRASKIIKVLKGGKK